ncbi:MAG: RidA family protein [Acidobacteria bacterium]|nr:RidA family protein [Acidobacteriota bacterium]
MAKQYLNLDGARPPGYTHVVTSPPGKLVFVSGRGGANPDGSMPADFETQCVNTFEDLRRCLALAGASFADVVKVNYFITSMSHLPVLRSVRARYLDMERPPAATLVESGLIEGLLVEIECTAVVEG